MLTPLLLGPWGTTPNIISLLFKFVMDIVGHCYYQCFLLLYKSPVKLIDEGIHFIFNLKIECFVKKKAHKLHLIL
jgi:hypothetical protein